MAYLGRYILGQQVPLSLRTNGTAVTPGVPAASPAVLIYSNTGIAHQFTIPVLDAALVTGWYHHQIPLDSRFSVGLYHIAYSYTVGGTSKGGVDSFEVIAGGDADGAGISMHYFRHPNRNYVLLQTDGGLLKKLRNPRLTT